MKVCRDEERVAGAHLDIAKEVSQDYPVVVSQFVRGARELEMDGVAKDGEVVCCQAHEHVEDAGVHSGDASLLLPPQTLSDYVLRRAREAVREIVKQLQISGDRSTSSSSPVAERAVVKTKMSWTGSFASMNDVRVIECNLRASRSVPFVSKATGVDFADVATRVLAGLPLPDEEKLPQLFPREGQAPAELRRGESSHVLLRSAARRRSRLRRGDVLDGRGGLLRPRQGGGLPERLCCLLP